DTGSGALTGAMIERLERDALQREAKARDGFNRFCTGAGLAEAAAPAAGGAPTAEWHAEIGDEPRWLTAYGTAADLIVARRGGGEDLAARSAIASALLGAGLAVL